MSGIIKYFVPQANAAVDAAAFGKVLDPVIENLINPVVLFLFGLAVVYFVFGVVQMIRNGDDPAARETGRKHMFFGVLGMFIMLSAWGIIYVISATLRQVGEESRSQNQQLLDAPQGFGDQFDDTV